LMTASRNDDSPGVGALARLIGEGDRRLLTVAYADIVVTSSIGLGQAPGCCCTAGAAY
jgi:hypothetical protein